ncbi:MAG TPA: penicillin acylase family protein [Vicinamibacterales bacterium]|nr:penicillin acylase family protein [Vicinamibacterales bacterium]
MKRLAVVLTLVLLAVAGLGGWWWVRESLPVLDGQLSMPGLRAPVEVLFDRHGVPSVYARDPEDAWFAAGVLHARDRRWQMELYRRVTVGRLSEVLGTATIAFDKRFLTLGLRDAAKAEWDRANPAVRVALERYAAGVNAATAAMTGRKRPLEFQLLGIEPPPWKPIDSLAVGRLLAWRLSENHQAELIRAALIAKFGDGAARQLMGAYPPQAPAILDTTLSKTASARLVPDTNRAGGDARLVPDTNRAGGEARLVSGTNRAAVAGLEWLAAGARRGNSNNWVLSGQRTRSGRPILANDPHLQIEFPSVWYQMHLVAAGLDVIGVTIPGLPFVMLGHNARVAWGMTATGADVQDLFLERIDVSRRRAWHRGEWVPVDITRADIPVRGRSAPLRFEVWKTRHGPIFSDTGLDWDEPPTWLSPDDRPAEERRAYSIRWEAGGDPAAAFEALNRATDWTTFTAAVRDFSTPSMNIVYADVDGNVGYAMSGRLPIRSGSDGTAPVDGNQPAAWNGAVDPDALPRAFNPESGVIFSANNAVDRRFGGAVTRDWTAGFRATRLRDQLANLQGADLDAMAALQTDRRSVAADAVLAGLDDAIATGRSREHEAAAVTLLDQLAKWDRVVDARPVVSLYEAFEDALWRRAFVDELDEDLFAKFYEWAGAEKPAGLYAILGDRESRWLDDITTVERRENRDDIFLLAIRDADERLQAEFGGASRRGWDRVHAARFSHPLGNIGFPFRWLFDRGPVPLEGDGTTIMRVSWNRLSGFGAWEYPSWRQIIDVGNWDDSRVAMPAGQSGHPLSAFYFDQTDGWRAGQYRTQPFTRHAVQAAAAHRLLLVP